jgi:hypothetical protein
VHCYLVCHITSARPSNVTKVMHEVWMQMCAEVAIYFIILFVYLVCVKASFLNAELWIFSRIWNLFVE